MKRKAKKPIYTTMAVKWDFEFLENCENREWLANNPGRRPYIRERLWGFFYDLRTAKRAVRQNWGDNFDEAYYYNGAIVEQVNPGYFDHPHPPRRWFFRHKPNFKKGDKYFCIEMKEPKYYKRVIGLTMG